MVTCRRRAVHLDDPPGARWLSARPTGAGSVSGGPRALQAV